MSEETDPGIGPGAQILALQRTVDRLRAERNALRVQTDSEPPPTIPNPTRGQKAGKAALIGTKWAILLPAVALVARAAARKWPGITEIVDGLLGALGL